MTAARNYVLLWTTLFMSAATFVTISVQEVFTANSVSSLQSEIKTRSARAATEHQQMSEELREIKKRLTATEKP